MNGSRKTLLLATDFSARCDRPLERALQLRQQWSARLILLHILEKSGADMADEKARQQETAIKARLDAELGADGSEVETRIARGAVHDAIATVAKETQAELVLTGVARMDDLGDFVLGNTVDRLVRSSPVPVLVVKKRARASYRSIVVATDFSDCSAAALRTAAAMFPDAELHLVHAYHVPFEGLIDAEGGKADIEQEHAAELATFLDSSELPADVRTRLRTHLSYGEPEHAIQAAVDKTGSRLAVIGTHGRSGFVAAMIGSVAETLLSTLDCDVLVAPSKRSA